jgi:hypothetical protein
MASMTVVLVAWGIVSCALVVMLIYRSMLGTHDEEQLFLDPAERVLAKEQEAVVKRIERLGRPIATLFVLSGILIVTAAGFWLWQGLRGF